MTRLRCPQNDVLMQTSSGISPSFANSKKQHRFRSQLSVPSGSILNTAILLTSSIIPESMQNIKPDCFQYFFLCKCCVDVARWQRHILPEFLLPLGVGWWGMGDCANTPASSQRQQSCALLVRLIIVPTQLEEGEFFV